ncbi:hypothetical protein BY458DRAFT_495216, partial [Sporodiniella umbellata]
RTQSTNNTHQFERPLKRKRPSSPIQSTTQINTLSRTSSFLSEVGDEDQARWTRHNWKTLEEYYVRKDRDCEKAANAFYYCESLIRISEEIEEDSGMKELWSKEKILWRCKCIDTRFRYLLNKKAESKRHKAIMAESESDCESFSIPGSEKSLQTKQ